MSDRSRRSILFKDQSKKRMKLGKLTGFIRILVTDWLDKNQLEKRLIGRMTLHRRTEDEGAYWVIDIASVPNKKRKGVEKTTDMSKVTNKEDEKGNPMTLRRRDKVDYKIPEVDEQRSSSSEEQWSSSREDECSKIRPMENTNENPKRKIKSFPDQVRRLRCGECAACRRKNCTDCIYCRDMTKYGGPGILRQSCVERMCEHPGDVEERAVYKEVYFR